MVVVQLSTEADFQSKVKGSGAKLAVVDFYATWCGPCKTISPKLEKMSEDFADVLFFKVDVDELDTVAQSCGVSAMPTFQFFKNGEKVDELVGASEEKLKAMITKNK